MNILYSIILMFIAIIISDILYKLFPKIPLIFFQIIVGILISLLPVLEEFELEPELFMIVIIKPLIFSEAQHVSREELKKYKKEIISLSFILVILTVLVTGALIKLIIPAIPLAFLFILVSITIPTNVNFMKSISHRFKFPKEILAVLEGESLFNDSIAIVMFDLALTVSITGEFSFSESIEEFIFIILGGILVGFILGFIIVQFRIFITRRNLENPPMMVILQLITPFVVFIIAEEYINVSGILAVIVAGMIHIAEQPVLNLKSTKLQVISNSTWDVVEYVLEGLVAVILGISIPSVIKNIIKGNELALGYLILIALLLYCIVIGLRYLWIMINPKTFKLENNYMTKNVYRTIFALGGVHGTITLAIALSLPEYVENDILSRNDVIFIATIVILISLIVPVILFPFLLNRKETDQSKYDFQSARLNMIAHAISQLELLKDDSNYNSLGVVLRTLRGQLIMLNEENLPIPEKNKTEEIFAITTAMEKKIVDEMINENKIHKEVADFYKLYIEHFNKRSFKAMIIKFKIWLINKKIKRKSKFNNNVTEYFSSFMKEFEFVKSNVSREVLEYLRKNVNDENYPNISFVIKYYERKLSKNNDDLKINSQEVRSYFFKAFDIELTFIQDYLEENMISPKIADELRKQVSYDEMIYINQ